MVFTQVAVADLPTGQERLLPEDLAAKVAVGKVLVTNQLLLITILRSKDLLDLLFQAAAAEAVMTPVQAARVAQALLSLDTQLKGGKNEKR
jgi:hypothetical protein